MNPAIFREYDIRGKFRKSLTARQCMIWEGQSAHTINSMVHLKYRLAMTAVKVTGAQGCPY
jgi:hypothetical protein